MIAIVYLIRKGGNYQYERELLSIPCFDTALLLLNTILF